MVWGWELWVCTHIVILKRRFVFFGRARKPRMFVLVFISDVEIRGIFLSLTLSWYCQIQTTRLIMFFGFFSHECSCKVCANDGNQNFYLIYLTPTFIKCPGCPEVHDSETDFRIAKFHQEVGRSSQSASIPTIPN